MPPPLTLPLIDEPPTLLPDVIGDRSTMSPDRAFDDIATLAAQICGVPIGIVAFEDGRRHATASAGELAMPGSCLADAPGRRFRTSAPIITASGAVAGAVWVMSSGTHSLDALQAEALRMLARQAAALLDLRDAVRLRTESNELLDLVLQGGELGLWDLHVPSGQWSINAREREMLGYSVEEAQPGRLDWKSLVHPDDWAVVMIAYAHHLSEKTPYCESVHRMRHRSGRWIWAQHRAVVVACDALGRMVRVVGTHRDITAERLADEDRRKNGERLELAMSGGDIGLWDLDLRTGRATYNEQWWRMFGYAPGEIEVVDGLWKSVVHPLDYERARAELQLHVEGKTPMYLSEVRILHEDGRWLWIQSRAKVVERDPEGAALRIVGINLNITRSKEDSVALGRAGALLKRTSALAKVGGWEFDAITSTMHWSDEVFRIHDLEPSWKPGVQNSLAFYPGEGRVALQSAIDAAISSGASWDLELPLKTAKGRDRWIRALGQPEFDDDGGLLRLVGSIQDITERRHAHELLEAEQLRLRHITDNMPASVTHLDTSERYTFANRFAGQFFDADAGDMLGRTMREVRGEALYASLKPYVALALQGTVSEFESEGTVGGRRFYTQSTFIPDVAPDGSVRGFYAMTFDITRRKRAEIRSAESEKRLRGLTDNVPALLTELDLEGNVVFCNGRYQTWLGIAPSSVVNRPIRDTIGEAHFDSRKSLFARAYAGETVSFEQAYKLLTGERILQTTYLPQTDVDGKVIGLYCLAHDVTELKQKEMQLDILAREDALTTLPNRRSFEERVHNALARSRRSRMPLCLMYLDIDHFKSINDSHGHGVGDAVLKELALRLRNSVRETDMAARFAGDEFVVLLEGVANHNEAALVARKILKSVQTALDIPGGKLKVTISIGCALSENGAEDAAALLARADRALYAAKKDGRNRFRMADEVPRAA